jgi:hypothetical protein
MSHLTTPENASLAALVNALDDDAREYFEERAGILEFDAGYRRPKAERLAREETVLYLKKRKSPSPEPLAKIR